MTGNSILAPNLPQGNAGADWEQMKTSGIWGLPNVRNTHSSATSMILTESAKGDLALGGYETQILAMRFPIGILYYR